MRRRPPRWALLVVWGAAIGSYVLYARSRGLGPIDVADELRSLLADHWWGVALFVVAYVARPLVLFPASVLTVLAGLAYGLFWGVVLTIIASNLSTAANYGVGRYLAAPEPTETRSGPVRGAIGRAVQRPFESALIMRLVALPFDAVGYLAGFARLSFWPFLAGSALGTVVGTIAFVGFGASIDSLDQGTPTIDTTLVAVSVGLTIAGIFAARWLRARRPLDPDPQPLSSEVLS